MALNTPFVAAISKLAMVAPSAPPSTISSAVTLEIRKTGLTRVCQPAEEHADDGDDKTDQG